MKLNRKNAAYFTRITGVLLIITMCVALLLSFVNEITKDVITENEEKKTMAALKELFPDAVSPETQQIETVTEIPYLRSFYRVTDSGSGIGYYAEVNPTGFKGEVNMLVGITSDGKICGIRIISMNETVGIGDKIEDDSFLSGFIGKSGSVSYKKGADGSGKEMDGISGATYSSKAVIAGANAALAAYNAHMISAGS